MGFPPHCLPTSVVSFFWSVEASKKSLGDHFSLRFMRGEFVPWREGGWARSVVLKLLSYSSKVC